MSINHRVLTLIKSEKIRDKYLLWSTFFLLTAASLTLTGCSQYRDLPPGTVKEIRNSGFTNGGVTDLQNSKPVSDLKTASPVISTETVTVLPLDEPSPSPDYIVGPFDVLSINVSGNTIFSSSSALKNCF